MAQGRSAAGVGGPLFGRIDEVSSNDATTFLPASSDSTQVQKRLGEFVGRDAVHLRLRHGGLLHLCPRVPPP